MKIFYILLFCSLTTFSQHNFKIKEYSLIWTKTYNSEDSLKSLKTQLLKNRFKVEKSGKIIAFTNEFDSSDLKPFGFKTMSYPTYIQLGGKYFGYIELKENKFTVTINKITVVNAYDNNLSLNLEDFILKNGKINHKKHHLKTLKTLSDYLETIFKPTPIDYK